MVAASWSEEGTVNVAEASRKTKAQREMHRCDGRRRH